MDLQTFFMFSNCVVFAFVLIDVKFVWKKIELVLFGSQFQDSLIGLTMVWWFDPLHVSCFEDLLRLGSQN